MKPRLLLASAAALLLLAGCGAGGADGPEGTWGVDAPSEPNLEILEDGSFAGTDGCNRIFGGWEADGPDLTFSEVGSTMMACEGVDTWLSGLATATIIDDVMHVEDTDGTEIGTLERS